MNKITLSSDLKDLFKYVIAGAIGFGVGGIVWGFISTLFTLPIMTPFGFIIKEIIGWTIMGAIGGAALGLCYTKKIQLSLVAGMVGFGFGYAIAYILWFVLSLLAAIGIPLLPIFYLNIGFFVGGAIAATIYGKMLNIKNVSILIGLTILGIGLDFLISVILSNGTSGLILGIFFGLGLYLSENL